MKMNIMNLSNMSKKSKTIAATAFILGVAAVGATTFSPGTASAQTATNSATANTERANHIASLVTALSQKFNLNSAEVQSVIDTVMTADRAKMEAEHAQHMTTRLNQAVTDGKITQAQATLITTKIQETKAFVEGLKNKTEQERKIALKTFKETLEKWAADNNIPKQFIALGGHDGGKGPGGFGGFGGNGGPKGAK